MMQMESPMFRVFEEKTWKVKIYDVELRMLDYYKEVTNENAR